MTPPMSVQHFSFRESGFISAKAFCAITVEPFVKIKHNSMEAQAGQGAQKVPLYSINGKPSYLPCESEAEKIQI